MSGKIIVITGASGGLGQALSRRFVRDGEQVAMLGRNLEKTRALAEALGPNAQAFECRVDSPESIAACFAQLRGAYPRIDVLINGAAIVEPFRIDDADDAEVLRVFMTNLGGPIFTSRAAMGMMTDGGTIINVSSESVDLPFPHLIMYKTCKAGLEMFSVELNKELWDRGIRVAVARAGGMRETGNVAPEGAGSRLRADRMVPFMAAALANGLDLANRGMSSYDSVTDIFRHVIDSPADTQIDFISFKGRPIN